MHWPELLFIAFLVVLGISISAFGWGVLVLILVAWLLGAMLVAAVKYEVWRTQSKSMQAMGTWQNLELHTGEAGQAAMVMLRIKDYSQVRLTIEEVKQLRDRLDSALKFSATDTRQD